MPDEEKVEVGESGEKKPLLSRKQFLLFLLIPFFGAILVGYYALVDYGANNFYAIMGVVILGIYTFVPFAILIAIFEVHWPKIGKIIEICLIYWMFFLVFSFGAAIAARPLAKMSFNAELERGKRVAIHLEEYRKQEGSYPESLTFLREKGLLLYHLFEQENRYELTCQDPFGLFSFYLYDSETNEWQYVDD